MFHRNHWWFSDDGGHNFKMGNLPGAGAAFDYVRLAGSRSEPSGTVFALMDAPAPGLQREDGRLQGRFGDDDDDDRNKNGTNYNPMDDDEYGQPDDPAEEMKHEMDPFLKPYVYNPGLMAESTGGNVKYLMSSQDFGNNWTWTPMPANLQAGGLAIDPTKPNSLFALTANCLSQSTDQGKTWSQCSTAKGLTGGFSKLLIKDSSTMFMLRTGAVPLRTKDGGASWEELSAASPLFKGGATMDGSLSWTGNTLVLMGNDASAIGRHEYGTLSGRAATTASIGVTRLATWSPSHQDQGRGTRRTSTL